MNTSRKILKSDGTQIDADNINSALPYPSGSYNFFTAVNGVINTSSSYTANHLRFYNIDIRSACQIDRFSMFVGANATPTAGAKVGFILGKLINSTTMQVVANIGEADATIIGSTNSVQAFNISPAISLTTGQYWIGIAHSNATSISLGGVTTQTLSNYISTPNDVFTPVCLFEYSGAYVYPRTVGSNITVGANSYTNTGIAKFRIV